MQVVQMIQVAGKRGPYLGAPLNLGPFYQASSRHTFEFVNAYAASFICLPPDSHRLFRFSSREGASTGLVFQCRYRIQAKRWIDR